MVRPRLLIILLQLGIAATLWGQSDRVFDVAAGWSAGLFNGGPGVALSVQEPWGGTAGLWSRAAWYESDVVPGLTEVVSGYQVQPYAGWAVSAGPVSLALGLFISVEYRTSTQQLVDPAHGIDSSYSANDFVLDSGVHFQALWRVVGPLGAVVGLHYSFRVAQDSHAFFGLNYSTTQNP